MNWWINELLNDWWMNNLDELNNFELSNDWWIEKLSNYWMIDEWII